MRDSKRVEGATPVEFTTQSRKAGTADGGTCLKLSDNEVITEEAIFNLKLELPKMWLQAA